MGWRRRDEDVCFTSGGGVFKAVFCILIILRQLRSTPVSIFPLDGRAMGKEEMISDGCKRDINTSRDINTRCKAVANGLGV